ncbi:UNVERIFIED_ORG: hypothetical protein M2154_000141 [Enterobacter sp. JUb101]
MEDMMITGFRIRSVFQQVYNQQRVNKGFAIPKTGVSLTNSLDRINGYNCQNIYLEYL